MPTPPTTSCGRPSRWPRQRTSCPRWTADSGDGQTLTLTARHVGASLGDAGVESVAIARALVRKPGIYLFDDSFSALDLATDAHLRAALVPWTRDATVIVVGQRVSSIRSADQILVLEDGHQVGLGTHEQLIETCPTYLEIVESQRVEEPA